MKHADAIAKIKPAWQPEPNIKNHAGAPITPDQVFFAAPPATIGRVISASSTLSTQPQPSSLVKDSLISIGIGLIVGLPAWAIVSQFTTNFAIAVGLPLIAGIAMAVWLFYESIILTAECSYVGELGIARYSIRGSITPKADILLFENAAHLHTALTRRYKNGVYQGTNYSYTWKQRNQPDYKFFGTYFSETAPPPVTAPYYFGAAAEAVWTQHLLKFANQDLQEKGCVEFPVGKDLQSILVGSNFLEFITKAGERQRTTVADMQNIELKSGWFRFKHRDAKWWSGKGKYSFSYGSMPNAQLFLICLRQLAGVQFS